jgi:hypothetical protein
MGRMIRLASKNEQIQGSYHDSYGRMKGMNKSIDRAGGKTWRSIVSEKRAR